MVVLPKNEFTRGGEGAARTTLIHSVSLFPLSLFSYLQTVIVLCSKRPSSRPFVIILCATVQYSDSTILFIKLVHCPYNLLCFLREAVYPEANVCAAAGLLLKNR